MEANTLSITTLQSSVAKLTDSGGINAIARNMNASFNFFNMVQYMSVNKDLQYMQKRVFVL
jgi:hypothetical protein